MNPDSAKNEIATEALSTGTRLFAKALKPPRPAGSSRRRGPNGDQTAPNGPPLSYHQTIVFAGISYQQNAQFGAGGRAVAGSNPVSPTRRKPRLHRGFHMPARKGPSHPC